MMEVPILKQGDYLIASIQGALSDSALTGLQENLIRTLHRHRSRGVVIDLTVLDVMDSFAARTLRAITVMTRLLGARVVLVGIQPEIAFSMVQLGLTLEGTPTGLDLEDGLALLKAWEHQDGSWHHGR